MKQHYKILGQQAFWDQPFYGALQGVFYFNLYGWPENFGNFRNRHFRAWFGGYYE